MGFDFTPSFLVSGPECYYREMFCNVVACIKAIVPWIFALGHGHYARWLPFYLKDQENLHDHALSLYKQFSDGHFTVKKTTRICSNIGRDRAHEQNNKLVEIDCGAVGILYSP